MTEYKQRPGETLRSWQVIFYREGPVLEGSNWAPGYTDAHKATRLEAVEYALDRTVDEQLKLATRAGKLFNMQDENQCSAMHWYAENHGVQCKLDKQHQMDTDTEDHDFGD